jgi:integrase/recombinase XerD
MTVQISIYHDTRRAKANGLYPVKLRVYYKADRRLYATGVELSKDDFNRSYNSPKPQKEFRDIKLQIIEVENKANQVATSMSTFNFENFEKKLFRSTGDNDNVIYYYQEYIKELKSMRRISTASNYDLSLKSIIAFVKNGRNIDVKYLGFETITPKFLENYEEWMLEKGKKLSTVGIYLRPLRAIFNNGKTEGVIQDEIYPFGKKKYQIPAGKNSKKALTREELGKFYKHDVIPGSEQEKARDYWFFSYQCNGINIKDIAHLKVSDYQRDVIVFHRAKTQHTTKGNSKSIVVAVTDKVRAFIEKYRQGTQKSDYLFPIISKDMDAEKKHKAVQNFVRFINQHVKNICKDAGITVVSSYWARHSYATTAVRNGASMEYVGESLGHTNVKTTHGYFAGFEENVKRDIAEKLMDFE